ncbi:Highly reducing polyketide synthase alt5 [Diaporthe amygdali]|uniref:Highly reducing polyketide synthase alt5 n=1 Tax=Phomopsis amygdali TaxID=1214568 RepID=UPI0022FE9D18|nr:Highly reducing polyketide synthase alt5 [Diaporthe amygdali]KAJ0108381.1 Highly reducing polyketide synthase alt5 [Diaporthe amygdali]
MGAFPTYVSSKPSRSPTPAEIQRADLQTALTAAPPMGEALRLVCEALMRKLAKAMMIELEDLDSSRPASSYGVDSVVAVEVRRGVFKAVKSDISEFDISSNTPLTQLASSLG